jgi:glycosyltransferase involved in cell wall biosynthesis
MDANGGVGGVACALQGAFEARGVAGPPITLGGYGRPLARPGRVRRSAEILGFTVKGSLEARRARRAGAVVLVHGDALGGDLFVDHGLHKALVARRPWLLVHPLHLFILAREELRHLLCRRTLAVSLSEEGRARLARAYPLAPPARLQPIPNGVDLHRFRPDPAHLEACPAPGALTLAFVGHEFARKGLRHVLQALVTLPERVRLEVVGGCPGEIAAARRRARELGVESRVVFHGVRPDVETVLRRAHLFVLPSAQEAFPLAALEAMACGAGLILSGTPAAAELVGREEAGRVVAASGPVIAAAVRALLAEPEALTALRKGAVRRAARFTWDAAAERYIALAAEIRRARPDPGR